jgi:pentatricopeptide repeat protein
MVAGYARSGHVEEALELFRRIPQRNVISWNEMIVRYAQSGCHDKALKLFWEMPERDVVSWNAMIAGYAQNGCAEAVLSFYQQMQVAGLKPNSKAFASVIPSCANLVLMEQGKKIHEEVIRNGFQYDIVVANALVDMYGKCGSIDDARNIFDKMPQRDVISWNAMIAGYAQSEHIDEPLKLFQEMPEQNVVSWTAMISGYASS